MNDLPTSRNARIAPLVSRLIPRLASNFDAEVVETARAIGRVLKSNGQDFHDLASAVFQPSKVAKFEKEDWRATLKFCAKNSKRLNDRELDFIAKLAHWRGQPTAKQMKWLREIAEWLRAAA